MKKILITLSITFVILSGLSVFFAWPALKPYVGLIPILKGPPADIADLIEEANEVSKNRAPDGKIVASGEAPAIPLDLPDGFAIFVYARDLERPRVIIEAPRNTLITSLTGAGQVAALPDADRDGRADDTIVLLRELNNPHGLALKCETDADCRLFVAETGGVSVYDYDPARLAAANRSELFDLPDDGGHFTRTIMIAEIDGVEKLLVSVGSSCNVCHEADERRAKILVAELDGGGLKTFASGLRNSVFMAEHPTTGDIWATENGRDLLGDNLPPDEINIIKEGNNYGWPICYGQNIHDTDFDKNTYIRNPCLEPFETPSHIDLPAHSAPLGIGFFQDGWPEEFRLDALAAFHGSWNRSVPTGYKIVRFRLDDNGGFEAAEDFITGWLTPDNEVLGRPAGILVRPGDIFVTDDFAGVVYRVIYKGG